MGVLVRIQKQFPLIRKQSLKLHKLGLDFQIQLLLQLSAHGGQ